MNFPWWRLKNAEAAQAMVASFRAIMGDQMYRRTLNSQNLSLYGNLQTMGLSSPDAVVNNLPSSRLTLNVVQAVIDTAQSMLAAQTPKVMFLTNDGDYELQNRAKYLTDFVSGQFYQTNAYSICPDVFKDAAIFGTGFGKVFVTPDGEIRFERVFPDEIFVDDIEGRYGNPRTLYQHTIAEKTVLYEMYPKMRAQIEESGVFDNAAGLIRRADYADPVSVVEAWRLSPDGRTPGRHIIAVDKAALVDEVDWKETEFPIIPFRWCPLPIGYWGQGLVTQLKGIQLEINSILRKIQNHLKLASSHVFLFDGSKVVKEQLTNEEWSIIEVSGDKAPVFQAIQAISPEYGQYVAMLYERAFELAGVSQMSAQAQKPAGLTSGRAIRESNDLQSRRFLLIGQAYERFHQEIAGRIINLTKQLAEDATAAGKEYKVLVESKTGLREFDWKDLNLDEDSYRMKGWPTNLLPDTPAGKVQTVQELVEVLPQLQPYALELLDYPDIQAVTNKLNAPARVMQKIIYEILERSNYIAPEEFMDLQGGIKQMQYSYLNGITENVPESKLALMRQWVEDAMAIMQRTADAAAQEQAAMMAAQQAQMPAAAPGAMPGTPQGGAELTLPAAEPNVPV